MKLFGETDIVIIATQTQQIELIQLILDRGLPIDDAFMRYPIDNHYPYLFWDADYKKFNRCTDISDSEAKIIFHLQFV